MGIGISNNPRWLSFVVVGLLVFALSARKATGQDRPGNDALRPGDAILDITATLEFEGIVLSSREPSDFEFPSDAKGATTVVLLASASLKPEVLTSMLGRPQVWRRADDYTVAEIGQGQSRKYVLRFTTPGAATVRIRLNAATKDTARFVGTVLLPSLVRAGVHIDPVVRPGDSVPVRVLVAVSGHGVTGARVRAAFESRPEGRTDEKVQTTDSVYLEDTGRGADEIADDGVYTAAMVAPPEGSYTVFARITGVLPGGIPFVRTARRIFTSRAAGLRIVAESRPPVGTLDSVKLVLPISVRKAATYEVTLFANTGVRTLPLAVNRIRLDSGSFDLPIVFARQQAQSQEILGGARVTRLSVSVYRLEGVERLFEDRNDSIQTVPREWFELRNEDKTTANVDSMRLYRVHTDRNSGEASELRAYLTIKSPVDGNYRLGTLTNQSGQSGRFAQQMVRVQQGTGRSTLSFGTCVIREEQPAVPSFAVTVVVTSTDGIRSDPRHWYAPDSLVAQWCAK